jgi:hypothetical protein
MIHPACACQAMADAIGKQQHKSSQTVHAGLLSTWQPLSSDRRCVLNKLERLLFMWVL